MCDRGGSPRAAAIARAQAVTGRRGIGGHPQGRRRQDLRAALLRRPVRRGAGQYRDRRGQTVTDAGVFSAGRIINPRLARSQLIGGMTMGLSMALHEDSVLDERFGHVINHDFAGYHIAANADVANLNAVWLDEVDERSNPMGSRGIGEIGIVGAAAAVANAVYHATGKRIRDLPITLDKLLT